MWPCRRKRPLFTRVKLISRCCIIGTDYRHLEWHDLVSSGSIEGGDLGLAFAPCANTSAYTIAIEVVDDAISEPIKTGTLRSYYFKVAMVLYRHGEQVTVELRGRRCPAKFVTVEICAAISAGVTNGEDWPANRVGGSWW